MLWMLVGAAACIVAMLALFESLEPGFLRTAWRTLFQKKDKH